jgi:hypothetical protein
MMPAANAAGSIMDDLSVGALQAAVFGGKGFHSPRMLGAALVGLSILCVIANVAYIFITMSGDHYHFFPYLFALASIFGCAGGWLLVIGQPRAMADGQPAPMWARLGLGAACALGILIGLGLIALAQFGF